MITAFDRGEIVLLKCFHRFEIKLAGERENVLGFAIVIAFEFKEDLTLDANEDFTFTVNKCRFPIDGVNFLAGEFQGVAVGESFEPLVVHGRVFHDLCGNAFFFESVGALHRDSAPESSKVFEFQFIGLPVIDFTGKDGANLLGFPFANRFQDFFESLGDGLKVLFLTGAKSFAQTLLDGGSLLVLGLG